MTDTELILLLHEDILNSEKRNKQLLTALRSAKKVMSKLYNIKNNNKGNYLWHEFIKESDMKRINKAIKND